jgi:hypothetical protein
MKECDMSLKKILTILVLTCVTLAVPAQEGLDFGAQIGLGTQTIDDTVYQTLNLRPDLAFGDFGVGLDVEINFQFYEDVDLPNLDFIHGSKTGISKRNLAGKP